MDLNMPLIRILWMGGIFVFEWAWNSRMRLTMVVAMTRELAMIATLPFLLLCCLETSAQTPGWSQPVNLKGSDSSRSEFLSMAVTPRGKVFAAWQSKNQLPWDLRAQIFLATSDGQVWSPPVAITDTGVMDRTPDIAIDGSGGPHVVWCEYGSSDILYKHFDGVGWSEAQNVSETRQGESYFPRIAIGSDNTVHFVWHDNYREGTFQVLYRSFNVANGWSPSVILSDTNFTGAFPHLVVGPGDTVHVAFCGEIPPKWSYEVFYRKGHHGSWSLIERITTDDTLESVRPDIALDRNGHPNIVWDQQLNAYGDFANGIRLVTKRGDTWSAPEVVYDTTESIRPSLAFDVNNSPHVIWYLRERANSRSSVLYSTRASGSGAWTKPVSLSSPVVVDPGESVIRADALGGVHALWGKGWSSRDRGIYYSRRSTVDGIEHVSDGYPFEFTLEQNYPNPFNPSTTIRFSLPERSVVRVTVYNPLGQEEAAIFDGTLDAGVHSLPFEGSHLASGMYFYRIQTRGFMATKGMMLIK